MTGLDDTLPTFVSADEIEAAFAPYVVERFAPDDMRWRKATAKAARKYSGPIASNKWNAGGQRTVSVVHDGYNGTWRDVSLETQLHESRPIYFEWRGSGMLARSIGRKRVHQLLLLRALRTLAPDSVLEVGFGFGLNLLLLSLQCPGIRFAGVELTQAGVDAARSLAADQRTAGRLADFAIDPVHDPAGMQRLDLRQGTADRLPMPDRSVDVAITVLALEQMESIRHAALAELARVARRHVVMIEPFADWNADGHRRDYIRRYDYFAGRIDELPRYGMKPVVATADIPNKLSFRAGLVVAAVES
jgi:hypothetical protein